MCEFFSFVSDGHGIVRYFDWEQRKQISEGKLFDSQGHEIENADSHTSIIAYYGILGKEEEKWNKYEYNPLTREFTVDQLSTYDDSEVVKKWAENLDFKTVVEPLVVKPIVDPRYVEKHEIDDNVIKLLEKWIEKWDSVIDSVWNSIIDSVGSSVWDFVWDSVWDSVGHSVWDSVGHSVWDSILCSLWNSAGDFRRAYILSFFGVNKYQCATDLWEMGFVASFDGTTWRLHQGENLDVVYERIIS